MPSSVGHQFLAPGMLGMGLCLVLCTTQHGSYHMLPLTTQLILVQLVADNRACMRSAAELTDGERCGNRHAAVQDCLVLQRW